ncbi:MULTISPECIES: PadR family transcriptional regulator [unclassified Microbacterium]|uniref:PadR family transcriptional regulator n=1 Tax=unclassified Microbacterium TaxID=2609290 RepID=UPI0006FEB656|nr:MULTISPECIES: PadR family transcriptional regulator [unclassified Microbacterium]AOX44764.1 PadR family transcriptional regulator [Microbacterium sp. BH-3-3-3]KQR89552.1 PadR family transcriptional regulator [Microbacterium sp. Leaf179]KQT74672.1 PadR family transcriptional regulator [Microbacterium sp. Leaf436]MBD8207167.1 PadR family transcriptional regulator [Microbacterium sp. CFBP 8801]MBD8218667.1 PadR family transcriptional regulator [Microbacterium sp. CFBP 13617]
MSGSFLGDAFGGRGGNNTPGWPMSNILDAMEQLRTQFEQKTNAAPRMNKGDVRSAVLSLLIEQPMHGYQIIREIEDRSGGSWKPSPGSVYPTLQLLTDEGLVQSEESNGRKTYSLTAEGRAAAGDETTERTAPWESATSRDSGRMTALPKAGVELAQAAAQVARTGDKEQVAQAVEILDEARRKLYSILAQG